MVDTLAERPGPAGTALPRRSLVSWWLPLLVFAATRLIDTALVLLASGHQDFARDPGPFVTVVDPAPAHPGYLDMLTNWDGQWYQSIAQDGYPAELPTEDGVVAQNPWAFYPLYPALVRAVTALSPLSFAAAASLVSLVTAAAAMVVLFRFLEPRVGRFHAAVAVLAVGLSPAGVVLQAAYTEGLALLLVLLCLSLLAQRRYAAVAVVAVALSLTRPVVLPMALVVVAHGVVRWRNRESEPFGATELRRCAAAAVVTAGSFGLWPTVCALRTGEPLGYLETQRAWIDAAVGEPTWLWELLRHPTGAPAFFALVATATVLYLVLRRGAAWGLEARVWVLAYGAYLLVASLPVAAVLRYAMLAVFPWWSGSDRQWPASRAGRVVVVVLVVVVGTALQVAWLRSFYVIGPHFRMNP